MGADYASLFDSALIRVERAAERRDEMGAIWSSYLETKPHAFTEGFDDQGHYVVRVTASRTMPPGIGIAFSEWLHNLRAGLDGCLYALAVAEEGVDPPTNADKLQFPIVDSPKDFRKQSNRLKGLSGQAADLIEQIQPYRAIPGPQANALYWVNELARLDRHRRLHLLRPMVAKLDMKIGLPFGTTFTHDDNVPTYIHEGEGAVVTRIKATPLPPKDKIQAYPHVEIELEVPEWRDRALAPMNKVSLDERMQRTEIYMRGNIEGLYQFATGEWVPEPRS